MEDRVVKVESFMTHNMPKSKQQSARKKLASQKHTLRMHGPELENVLSELTGNVLSCSCLKMLPDIAPQNQDHCSIHM